MSFSNAGVPTKRCSGTLRLLLTSCAVVLLPWVILHVVGILIPVPTYLLVPLRSTPSLYEKVAANVSDKSLLDGMSVPQLITSANSDPLSKADKDAIKWQIATEFVLIPRLIDRFEVVTSNQVLVVFKRFPTHPRDVMAYKENKGWDTSYAPRFP